MAASPALIVQQKWPAFTHLIAPLLLRLAAASPVLIVQQKLPPFTHLITVSCARGRSERVCDGPTGAAPTGKNKNKATADQSPLLRLVYVEPYPKERLRVSNWIVQRLYNYAVNETVEL